MSEFRMPSLGADMTEGTLLEWLVNPGDAVHRGDIVAVVDTSKSAIDVEVFEDGIVQELLVEPGTTVAVGTPLAMLGEEAERHHVPEPEAKPEPMPAPEPEPEAETAPPEPPASESPKPRRASAPVAPAHVPASPLARRRAAALGVDLDSVTGTGRGGAVTVADIEAAAEGVVPRPIVEPAAPKPVRAEGPAVPVAGTAADRSAAMRAAIGALMARSKREIPHYYLQTTIDLTAALAWLERTNADRSVDTRVLPAALLLKAAAASVQEVPEINGFFVDGRFEQSDQVHLGVAVSLRGGGLIAPALHDADTLSIDELMSGLKDLATRARSGKLRSSEMSDPTLTVTNLGEQGVDIVHGVIYPPQVALVGFGRIHEQPWAVDGMLTVRQCVIATLAADHRVTDGHRGGLYLSAIEAALHRPEEL